MFSVSAYAFHPLLQRFVALWRRVQLVSDCLACLLAALCCQCGNLMAMSAPSEKPSIESFMILPEPTVELGRASGEPFRAQHLVIDFTPQPGDTEETGAKCQQFWDVVNSHPDLGGMMAQPERTTQGIIESAVPVHRPSPVGSALYPALHVMECMRDRGVIDTALAASLSNKK